MDDNLIVGETYKSEDSRDTNRRIRVISREGENKSGEPRYHYIVVTHEDNKSRIGKTGFISLGQLQKRWTKTSH